jgi:hypothetical protein
MKKILAKNTFFKSYGLTEFKNLFNFAVVFSYVSTHDVKIIQAFIKLFNSELSYKINYLGACDGFQNFFSHLVINKPGLVVLLSFSSFTDLNNFIENWTKFFFYIRNNNFAEIFSEKNYDLTSILVKFNGNLESIVVDCTVFSENDFFSFSDFLNNGPTQVRLALAKNILVSAGVPALEKNILSIF